MQVRIEMSSVKKKMIVLNQRAIMRVFKS